MTEQDDVPDFSGDDFNAEETADMTVVVGGKPTGWKWSFAGPGHPRTIEQNNRLSRERLHRDRENEQRRLNGKKVTLPEESPDEVRAGNIKWVVERLVGWSPVKIDGEPYPFSPDNARKLLADPAKIGLLTQALEFLADEQSFTRRSATS